jgi:hypothetical protein
MRPNDRQIHQSLGPEAARQTDLEGEERPWIWNFAVVSNEQPIPAPNEFKVESEKVWIVEESLRKAKAISAVAYQP